MFMYLSSLLFSHLASFALQPHGPPSSFKDVFIKPDEQSHAHMSIMKVRKHTA